MKNTLPIILNILITLNLASAAMYAAPGGLDFTFDGDGKVTTQIGGLTFDGNAIAIQSDGKIIVAGHVNNPSPSFAVVRYNANGSLDLTFDGDGLATTDLNGFAIANAIVIQADGKIVVAGYGTSASGSPDFAVVRYNANGSLDAGFDFDGVATTAPGEQTDVATSMAIQTDGKIVLGGYGCVVQGEFCERRYFAVRYNANGSLDTAFDTDGILMTAGATDAIAIQTDGKLVFAGCFSCFTNYTSIARYNPNGTLDQTFGDMGVVTDNVSTSSIAIQPDGKLVTTGFFYNGSTADISVARYNADGSPDKGFGSAGTGKVLTNILEFDRGYSVKILSGGKIIVAGSVNDRDFAVVRYLANGALDTSWGSTGYVTTDFGTLDDAGEAMAIQADGKVVVAGHSSGSIAVARYFAAFGPGDLDPGFDLDGRATTENFEGYDSAIQPDGKIIVGGVGYFATADFAVLRYLPNGALDTTFDGDGIAVTPIGTSTDYVRAIRLQPDGKIIAAGQVTINGSPDFGVVRYNIDGSLDSTFDGDGIVTLSFGENDGAYEILVQPDGKIVVVGEFSNFLSGGAAIARLNTNGSLDTSFDGDGKVFNFLAVSYSAALQSDGKIVATGYQNSDFVVTRYNTDGSLDSAFDGDGMVTTDIVGPNDFGTDVVVQADGKIVVAGYQYGDPLARVIVVRYNQDGSLDSSFDGDGRVVVTYAVSGGLRIEAVALQPNGKILVGGLGNPAGFNEADFFITRFNSNGSLDTTWGTGGFVFTNFPGPPGTIATNDQVYSLFVQPNGMVVAAGFSNFRTNGTVARAAVARYFGDVLSPTAAGVSVGGRVSDTNGRAISNVSVTITDAAGGGSQTALTNAFGYYRFEEIEAGQSYLVEAAHKRDHFAPRFVNVIDEIADADLIAEPKTFAW